MELPDTWAMPCTKPLHTNKSTRRPSGTIGRLLVSSAIAGSVVAGLTGQVGAPTASAPREVVTVTPDATLANPTFVVLGYLWGDGWLGRDGKWHFRSSSVMEAERFEASALAAGIPLTKREKGKWFAYDIDRLPVAFDEYKVPPVVRQGSPGQIASFLSAVIECEGSTGGLVLDDPTSERADAMVAMLGSVGVHSQVVGKNFKQVFADKADWNRIHQFPFIVWARVPGGR